MKNIFLLITLVIALTSCGGGGGGAGGGGSDTGLRIINASIDAPPIEIVGQGVTDSSITKTSFSIAGKRIEIPNETTNIGVRSTVSGNILDNVLAPADKNGSFSLLVFGSTIDNNIRAKLLTEDLSDADAGAVKVRFTNAINKQGAITVGFAGKSVSVPYGSTSEYYSVSPIIQVVAQNSGGSEFSNRTFNLPIDSNDANKTSYDVVYMGEEGTLVFSKVY